MDSSFVKVADIARTSLHTINGVATVQDAIDLMKQNDVSSLVIERRNEADEYGIVSVSDIARKVVAVNRSTARVSVYEIMDKPALTLNSTMNIKYAIRLLSNLGYTRALVLREGSLLGLITLRDMVLAYTDQEQDPS